MQQRQWTSTLYFFAAAIGSSVGISNIWKFTYVAGENGGGAFVLIYALALLCIAMPAVIAEFVIGRRGGQSVVRNMSALAEKEGLSPRWRLYGWLAAVTVFIALSFYAVIAGWTIDYFVSSLLKPLETVTAQEATAGLDALLASPARMTASFAAFIILTAGTVALGVKNGLEKILGVMTPGLFVILGALLIYAALYGDFRRALSFMFVFDFSAVTPTVVLMAFGQAFFSLGVGVGVLMTIAAYMDKKTSIVSSALIVAATDGGVAILAGLAIFPIVFANGLSPAEGPGLIFVTLPVAFGQMPGGAFVGPLFFLLLAMAALTSAITMLEMIIACLEDLTDLPRLPVTAATALFLFAAGMLTVFSYNIWADVRPLAMISAFQDKTIFGLFDYFVSNLMMPIGGICVSIIAGWGLSRASLLDELNLKDGALFRIWLFSARYAIPAVITAVFIINLI